MSDKVLLRVFIWAGNFALVALSMIVVYGFGLVSFLWFIPLMMLISFGIVSEVHMRQLKKEQRRCV